MDSSEDPRDDLPPSERRGGKAIGAAEASEKGPWAAKADDGIAPAEVRPPGADETPADEPDLDSSVLGVTTGSDEPATDHGVDLSAGENADATTDGGPTPTPGREPDLRDAAAGPRQSDVKSAD